MLQHHRKLSLTFAVASFLSIASVAMAQINFPGIPSGIAIDPRLLLILILNLIWPVVVTVVIIMFVLAGFKFLNAKGDPFELATARRFVMWGVAGIIVIILAFSIVNIIMLTFFPPAPPPPPGP